MIFVDRSQEMKSDLSLRHWSFAGGQVQDFHFVINGTLKDLLSVVNLATCQN